MWWQRSWVHTNVLYLCYRGKENRPDLLTATLGSLHVNPPTGQSKSIVRPVKRVILHPDYKNVIAGRDIAMLYIENAINYTNVIKPACLSTDQDSYSSRSRCFLTGWGKIAISPDKYPNILQEAKYKLRSTQACNSSWNGNIKDSMACAGECLSFSI